MPTGYTYPVIESDDYTINEFVWDCARSFGAMIMLRYSPRDAKIDLDTVCGDTKYEERRLAETTKDLQEFLGATPEQRNVQYANYCAEESARHDARTLEVANIRRRCFAMLADLDHLEPPTEDHEGLFKFMREQLEVTIKRDGNIPEWHTQVTFSEWESNILESLTRSVTYYTKSLRDAKSRIASRKAWVTALMEEVPLPEKLKP